MSAKNVTPVLKLIDLPPGHWQLFSYGQLSRLPTAKQAIWIRAFFRRVLLGPTGAVHHWTKEITTKDLPVGEMVAWQIGTIFDASSKRVYAAQAIDERIQRRGGLTVEFSDYNCRLIRRFQPLSENSEDVLFGTRGIPRNTSDADVYFLLVDRGAELPLLIPCTTVIQTFWSCSSNFLHMLLDSRFIAFDRYLVSVERSYFDAESKSARIWLRQWSLDSDARFLASIAFSQQAVQRGKDISARLHSAVADYPNQVVDRYLIALPPYIEPMTLDADVMPVQTALGTYLYVQRVIKSSYKPPFDNLVFDRDNDGRPQESSRRDYSGPAQPARRERKPFERPRSYTPRQEATSEYSLAQDHPGYQKLDKSVGLGRFDSIFRNLAHVAAEKLEQLEIDFESNDDPYSVIDTRWDGVISTLPGSSQSSIKALGANLASGQLISETEDLGTSPIGDYLNGFLEQYLEGLDDNFASICPSGVKQLSVTPVFPWKPNGLYDGRLTFSLPSEVDDYRWAYLYADPESEVRKRSVCLKISFTTADAIKTAYILDIEGRSPKSREDTDSVISGPPMLFFMRDLNCEDYPNSGARHSFSPKFMQDIVLNLVELRGDWTVEYLRRRGVIAKTRNHSEIGVPLRKLIRDLFTFAKTGDSSPL